MDGILRAYQGGQVAVAGDRVEAVVYEQERPANRLWKEFDERISKLTNLLGQEGLGEAANDPSQAGKNRGWTEQLSG
jgi:hypothetical protein